MKYPDKSFKLVEIDAVRNDGNFLREQFMPKMLINELTGGRRTILNIFGFNFLSPCVHCIIKERKKRLGSHLNIKYD